MTNGTEGKNDQHHFREKRPQNDDRKGTTAENEATTHYPFASVVMLGILVAAIIWMVCVSAATPWALNPNQSGVTGQCHESTRNPGVLIC